MGGFIVYTGFMLLLLFLYFLFFFLSYFQTLKIFVIIFSGTVRPRKLTLGTHVDSGQMYCVYQNQAAAAYSSLYFSFFFLSNFQTLKFFVTLFSGIVRPKRLKLGTHMDSGQMYRVYRNQAAAAYLSFYFFIFLSLNFSSHFSQELWGLDVWNLVHTWTVSSCIVYTAAYLSLYFFIFLSLNFHFFPFLKFLVHNISFSSDSAIAGL